MAKTNCIPTITEEQLLLQRIARGEINAFWPLWQKHQDYLFRCCLRRTHGNSTEAEDLLSQAMLKAREKLQDYAERIANVKAWLGKLIKNLWIDLARRRDGNQVEDIEAYAAREELGLVSIGDTPASALEDEDKKTAIAGAIDNLKPRMRETFILHFYEQLSHQEIAARQEISYDNVCKRISQARTILAEELRGYFLGEPGTEPKVATTPAKSWKAAKKAERVERILPDAPNLSERVEDEEPPHQEIAERQEISCQNVCKYVFQGRETLQDESRGYLLGENGTKTEFSGTPAVTNSAKEEISEDNKRVKASPGEPVRLSVAEPPKVALSQQPPESDSVAATAGGGLYRFNFIGKQIVEAVRPLLHRLRSSQLFDSQRTLVLEVKHQGCQRAYPACKREQVPILALTKFRRSLYGRNTSSEIALPNPP